MHKQKIRFLAVVLTVLCLLTALTGCGQQMGTASGPDAGPVGEGDLTCYLTISCATILDNMENLTEGKESLVPEDGILLPRTEIAFTEGQSVYDVLQTAVADKKIHMESVFTPVYDSAYIEGIGNLYEFDCGPQSGWMYSVNDWYPNYGVSQYKLADGDEIQLNYTCDLGRDLGQTWTE